MAIPVMSEGDRRRRVESLLGEIEALEMALLCRLASLEELTTHGDPLAVEIRRFVDLIAS